MGNYPDVLSWYLYTVIHQVAALHHVHVITYDCDNKLFSIRIPISHFVLHIVIDFTVSSILGHDSIHQSLYRARCRPSVRLSVSRSVTWVSNAGLSSNKRRMNVEKDLSNSLIRLNFFTDWLRRIDIYKTLTLLLNSALNELKFQISRNAKTGNSLQSLQTNVRPLDRAPPKI